MGNPGDAVQRLSPLHYKQIALKASMREYDGWLRAEDYGESAEREAEKALGHVGICDISPLEKLDIKGSNIDAFLEDMLTPKGVPRIPSEVSPLPGAPDGTAYACRLTKEHALVVGRPKQQELSRSPLDVPGFAPTNRCYLTNVTSVLAGLNVLGPSSTELLGELTQLDLSSHGRQARWCAEAGFAKVRSIIVRTDASSFDLFFGRDYAEYVWDELIHLGKSYSISPFGVAAYRLIRERKKETVR
jgi:glycine cleavage system aminomethyltransferase T